MSRARLAVEHRTNSRLLCCSLERESHRNHHYGRSPSGNSQEGETVIRKYQPSDLETLRQITAICFEGVSIDKNIEDKFGIINELDWKQRKMPHINDDVEANADGVFVAEIDGEVAGYITAYVNHRTKIGGIPNLSVHPNFQQRGLGTELIETALVYLKEEGMLYARIETLDQNQIGTAFYPKMGFVEIARQVHYIRSL